MVMLTDTRIAHLRSMYGKDASSRAGKDSKGCCARHRCSVTLLLGLAVYALIPGSPIIPIMQGVEPFSSPDLEAETALFSSYLNLRPGMTICEVGVGDGTLLASLGKRVMPNGHVIGTSINQAELDSATSKVLDAGIPSNALTTYRATNRDWAPGMPSRTCDAIYSRMVYHMIPKEVGMRYISQWRDSLTDGGSLFFTDRAPDRLEIFCIQLPFFVLCGLCLILTDSHCTDNPMDGSTKGPRTPSFSLFGVFNFMPVVRCTS